MTGFVIQVPLDVERQPVGRFVTAGAVLLEALHHDPVEIAAQFADELGCLQSALLRGGAQLLAGEGAHPGGGLGRLGFPDRAAHFIEADLEQFLRIEGRAAGHQLVEQDAQGVDVAAGVDVQVGHESLLGAHVGGGADELLEGGVDRLVGEQLAAGGLGHPEIDHLRHQAPVRLHGDENVRRFEVAVDDALLVRVLDRVADLHEQLEPFVGGELLSSQKSVIFIPRTSSITK